MKKRSNSVIDTALTAWLESNKRSLIKLSGNSMKPSLGKGSTVMVEHGSAGMGFGDVVVFRQEGTMIAHRIVRVCKKRGKPQFMTKGDRTLRCDPQFVDEDKILGKVVGFVKGEKVILLQTKYWKGLSFLLAMFSLVVGSAHSFIKRLK